MSGRVKAQQQNSASTLRERSNRLRRDLDRNRNRDRGKWNMRHRKKGRSLGRTAEHRKAMLRNMATSLFLHGRVETTTEKAKELRRYAEPIITKAKRGDLHARRLVQRDI